MIPSVRRSVHRLVVAGIAGLAAAGALAAEGCATGGARPGGTAATSTPPGMTPQDPGGVLSRFVEALEAGRWGEAHKLLSARWRGAYTSSRLAADFAGAGPLAREAAAHVRAALDARTPVQIADGRATLPVAGGRAVLVAEAAGWRVDALE